MSNELPLHVAAHGKCSFLLECGAIRSLSLSSFDRGHSLFQVLLTRWFVLLCCRCARAAMLDRRRFRLRSRHLEHTICVSCQKEVSRSGREGRSVGIGPFAFIVLPRLRKEGDEQVSNCVRARGDAIYQAALHPARSIDRNAESTAIFPANLSDARCQPLHLLRPFHVGRSVGAVIFSSGNRCRRRPRRRRRRRRQRQQRNHCPHPPSSFLRAPPPRLPRTL